jgi:DNA-binding Lrp family transcriptional regulator
LNTDTLTLAHTAINAILDGEPPPADVQPAELGKYTSVYESMLEAYQAGGTEAARKAYNRYASRDKEIGAIACAAPEPPRRSWTADQLLDAAFPEPRWTIPGILPTCLCFLGGRPKQGKSWMALQWAMAVGSGGRTLDRQVDRGKVLYLALEDSPRRLQQRLEKQRTVKGADVTFEFQWQPLTGQGAADLLHAIKQHGYNLIVIDTLSRALGRADQMDLADMNMVVGSLQRMAIDNDVTIVLVDHHRKGAGADDGGDVVDDMMGSTGKTGVADAILGIYRKRGQTGAILKVTGRDVEEAEYAIDFDRELGCWQLLGDADGVKADSEQANIITCMEELGGTATITEIAKWLGKQPPNVHREVQELVSKGLIEKLPQDGKVVPYRLTAKVVQQRGQG